MGSIVIQLTSADITAAINAVGRSGVVMYAVTKLDDLTVQLELENSCRKWFADGGFDPYGRWEIIREEAFAPLHHLKRRWVLLATVLLLMALTVFLPTKVLFISVDGNEAIPDQLILEYAKSAGINFGVARREVRSERVKNRLLQMMPQLQWVGVNTSGCTATISVRERSKSQENLEQGRVAHIVAARDGIVETVTVRQGSSLCQTGQAVKQGEILISGYTDCGFHIRAEQAEGEIFALTNRNIETLYAPEQVVKGAITVEERKYALLIGKNRINLYNDSGILGGSCDKMYAYSYVTLPGGFQLPLALITERWIFRNGEEIVLKAAPEDLLHDFSRDYLNSQMIAGQIMNADEQIDTSDGVFILRGNYTCHEMIGQILYEEIIRNDG